MSLLGLDVCGPKPCRSVSEAHDAGVRERLWEHFKTRQPINPFPVALVHSPRAIWMGSYAMDYSDTTIVSMLSPNDGEMLTQSMDFLLLSGF